MDNNSLAHIKWECKYHIVICTKISETGNLQRHQGKCRPDFGNIMPTKGNRDNRGRMHAGSVKMVRTSEPEQEL